MGQRTGVFGVSSADSHRESLAPELQRGGSRMFLGIDIGTSGVKSVLVDESGAPVEQQTAPLTVSRPRALWSEQDPESWWSATNSAVTSLSPAARRSVRAVGLS